MHVLTVPAGFLSPGAGKNGTPAPSGRRLACSRYSSVIANLL